MIDKAAVIKEAQRLLARGQIDKAIAEWEKLVGDSPDGNIHNAIGDLYLKKGDIKSAINDFLKAAQFFRQEGFSLKAIAIYKKVLNINPSNTDSLFALGELNEEKGLVTDGIKYYLAVADILQKEGKKERLHSVYDRILNLSPSNIPLRIKVAELFTKEGLAEQAAKEYLNIARLYEEKGETLKAKDYFKKVLDIMGRNKEALLGLSSICEKVGDFKNAVNYVKEAVGLNENDTDLLLRCAQLYISQNSYAEAIEYLNSVIAIEPSNVSARSSLGEIYLKQGDREKAWEEYSLILDEMLIDEKFEESIKILDTFRDIDPVQTGKRFISIYKQAGDEESAFRELMLLGDILLQDEKVNEALICYKEALQIHPDNPEVRMKIEEIEGSGEQAGLREEAPEQEKTFEEALADADIFIKYGLYDEAKPLLEKLRQAEPKNIAVHSYLKTLYLSLEDREQAVAECIILSELYGEAGDLENKEALLKEAYGINPDATQGLEGISGSERLQEEAPPVEEHMVDVAEEMSEAEVYLSQGLRSEAVIIYERLSGLFPENEEIRQKLSEIREEAHREKTGEKIAAEEKTEGQHVVYEPETTELHEISEPPEPALDTDVLGIFEEFKKSLESEVDAEDSETHYNLGIAYKEMGLIDDAIKEFQVSLKDPKKFLQAESMLGTCYLEKGLFPLAIDSFSRILNSMNVKDDAYWSVKYDLANAYEKNGNIKESFGLYSDIYGWNSKFRNVMEKINLLRVMLSKTEEPQKKTKERKDKVSYL